MESKFSLNCYLDHEDGYGGQMTVRGDTLAEWQSNFDTFLVELEARGYRRALRKQDAPQVHQPDKSPHGGEKFIEVESIVLAYGGEHPRWVVKGKPFTKFGITCWPEQLEAAGLLDKLDPQGVNTPKAKWRAYYIEKANDAGEYRPDKVVKLEKL